MKHTRFPLINTLHDIFTRDLTWDDLNNTLNHDLRGIYEFYSGSMQSVGGERNKGKRALKFIYHLFVAFLLKLSPPRRLFYAISVIFIVVSLSQDRIASALYSFVIINILLAMELADKLITKDELGVARDIQLSLQPTDAIQVEGYEVAAFSDVAKQVGGDYYDVFTLADGNTMIVVGDVSGKGISSALYVVKMQTALQLFASQVSDPKELLIKLNSYVFGQLKRNYFFSLFLSKLHQDGTIECCRAGHPPAFIVRAMTSEPVWIKPQGIAVGMVSSSNGSSTETKDFKDTIEKESLQMAAGDILFLYTDGLSESINRDGEELGIEKIVRLIQVNRSESADVLRKKIVQEVLHHGNGVELRDDTTFVLLKRR
jgi:sigma-B regulation protein RsbU (phosphoserine phosphatase)